MLWHFWFGDQERHCKNPLSLQKVLSQTSGGRKLTEPDNPGSSKKQPTTRSRKTRLNQTSLSKMCRKCRCNKNMLRNCRVITSVSRDQLSVYLELVCNKCREVLPWLRTVMLRRPDWQTQQIHWIATVNNSN